MRLTKHFGTALVLSMIFLASCLESDNPCPSVSFDVAYDSTSQTYKLVTDGLEDLTFSWSVDGHVIDTMTASGDLELDLRVEPGTYNICIAAESSSCDIPLNFCQEVTITGAEECLELGFDVTYSDDSVMIVKAEFEGIEETEYTWIIDGDSIETASIDEERSHLLELFLAEGSHEVCLVAYHDECGTVEFCSTVEIGGSHHDACPDFFFEKAAINDHTYVFEADFEGMDTAAYKWVVDGEIVDKENVEGYENDHRLEWEFGPGSHYVCAKSLEEGCEDVHYCVEFDIEGEPGYCPDMSFEYEVLGDTSWFFYANFEDRDSIQYKWYINGDVVDKENFEGYENDHQLYWEFGSGHYEVCVKAYIDGCEESVYCEEIHVDAFCPDLFFHKEQGDSVYYFTADFEGQDHIQYKWYVNEELVDKENYEEHETDHELTWQFGPGTHEVCIVAYIDGCEELYYCEVIESDAACPELFYHTENEGLTYYFTADFAGQENLPYKWYINDEIVDKENYDGYENDHKLVWQFEPGTATYAVCIYAEIEGCDELIYCTEVVIEEDSSSCVDVSFTGERDGDNPAYTFTATFDQRDSVDYIWKVYKGDDYQGGEERIAGSDEDHSFYWQFDTGVEYTVCLKQDGCEEVTCEDIFIEE